MHEGSCWLINKQEFWIIRSSIALYFFLQHFRSLNLVLTIICLPEAGWVGNRPSQPAGPAALPVVGSGPGQPGNHHHVARAGIPVASPGRGSLPREVS